MKNYEYIMKDLDSLIKFIKDNDFEINCDECNKYGLECNYSNCTKNAIEYLKMNRIDEVVPKNELSSDEFNKYIDKVRNLKNKINNIDTYTGVNYIRSRTKDLEESGVVFNENQKELLSKEFESIDNAIDHLETLRSIIDKYRIIISNNIRK